MDRPAALPRRPLTVGELLDAAVELVRSRAWPLLALSVMLALGEQAALYPIRAMLGFSLVNGSVRSFDESIGPGWLLLAMGFTIEGAIVAFLGVSLGAVTAADVSRRPTSVSWVLLARRGHAWMLIVAPLCTGLILTVLLAVAGALELTDGLAFLTGTGLGLVWLITFTLFGLSGAVIGFEGRGPIAALGRAAKLSARNGMRATWVRILGFLAWAVLRIGFYLGLMSLLEYVSLGATGSFVIVTLGMVIANAAAYLFLAALDAATVAEIRFRTEGLDVWLSRAEQHGQLSVQSVAARR